MKPYSFTTHLRPRLKRFWHCLVRTFSLKSHRAVTMWNDDETLIVGCDCGKIFYSKDQESVSNFEDFIGNRGIWDRSKWERKE